MRFTTLVSTAIAVVGVTAQGGNSASDIANFQNRLLSEAPTVTSTVTAPAATPTDLRGVILESLRESLQQVRDNIQTDIDNIRNAVTDTLRARPAARLASSVVGISRLIEQARERITGGASASASTPAASATAAVKRSDVNPAVVTLAKRAPAPPRGYRYRGCFLVDYSARGYSVWPRGGLASGLGGIEQCAAAAAGAEFLGATDLAGAPGDAFLCEWGADTNPPFGSLRAVPEGSCSRRCPDGREGCGGYCFVQNGRFNCFYSIYSRIDDTCDGNWREIAELIQLIIQLILSLQGQSEMSGIPSVLTSQQNIEAATEALRTSLGC